MINFFLREVSHRLKQVIFPVLGIGLICYFAFHSIQGERGIISYMRLATELERTQTNLDQLTLKRETLQHQVKLLHPKSLDPDMLEERARFSLNFANPRDVIIVVQ